MKKAVFILTSLALLLILSNGASLCDEVDLSGTWEGTTEIPDALEPDKITMELEKVDGKYKGTASDTFGMMEDTELEEIEFKDNTLTFKVTIFDGSDYISVTLTLEVEGNTMSGYWETEEGESAPVEFKKIT